MDPASPKDFAVSALLETQDDSVDSAPSIDFLTLGYAAMSMGSENAHRLFNIYTRSADCREIDIHFYPADNSYRRVMEDGSISVALCYNCDEKGAVVPQSIWQPAQRGDIQRHVNDAELLPPVHFIGTNHVVGIKVAEVLAANPRVPLDIYYPGAPALLGGRTNTHFCLKWPRYKEFRKQVELKNATGAPITMQKLAERIAKFVERFIQDMANQPTEAQHWRVGPGFITIQNIYIIGLLQVSRGVWQPILQLDHYNAFP